MNIEISRALGTLQGMANEFFAALPALGIALVVFVPFYYAAKGIQSLVSRVTRSPTGVEVKKEWPCPSMWPNSRARRSARARCAACWRK